MPRRERHWPTVAPSLLFAATLLSYARARFESAPYAAWLAVCCLALCAVRCGCEGPLKRQLYVYDLAFHAATSVLGVSALCAHGVSPWSDHLWQRGAVSVDWRLGHMAPLNAAYYTCALAIVLRTTPRRVDMLLHHAFATALSLCAIALDVPYAIAVSVVLHNVSDVCLLAGKLAKHDRWPPWLSDACMYAFVASWFACRMYLMNAYVWWPVMAHNALGLSRRAYWLASPIPLVIGGLQCYWSALIVRLVWRKARTGETQTDDDDE